MPNCDELETIATTSLDDVTGGCHQCGDPSHGAAQTRDPSELGGAGPAVTPGTGRSNRPGNTGPR